MVKTIQSRTVVLPGHRIEIQSPDLPEGKSALVLIILEYDENPKKTWTENLQGYRGGLFKTAKEVDDYIREERASWD